MFLASQIYVAIKRMQMDIVRFFKVSVILILIKEELFFLKFEAHEIYVLVLFAV